jgi:hypothetical protein
MDLEMVFNELSIRPYAVNIPTARERMATLVNTIASAIRLSVKPILRTNEEFQSALIAPNYLLAQWRNDPEVERDLKALFNSVDAKTPFLRDISDTTVADRIGRSEFKYKAETATGLGVAYLIEGLAISLMSDQNWNNPVISLNVDILDDAGEVLSETVEIVHACNPDHTERHEGWIRNRTRTGVRDGVDLWNRRNELFPFLDICENVGSQILGLGSNNAKLRPVMKRLLELNDYAAQWEEGVFDASAIPSKVSRESESTLREYGNERSFYCPDGLTRLFSWHARLTPGAWRLHFFPDPSRRVIIIGYIGPKLPTVSDPT